MSELEAFDLVVSHWKFTPEQIVEAKAGYCRDRAAARECFAALSREIIGDAAGINERMRAQIATQKEAA